MNKSVRGYRAMDLLLLGLFGCILEFLVTKFGGIMLGNSTITISFLIVILAVIRWNLWGLSVIPFLVLATMLGRNWSDIELYRTLCSLDSTYHNIGIAMYVSVVVGLSTIGLNVIFFKLKSIGTKKIVKNPFLLLGLIILDYLVFSLVQFVVFRLITSNNIMQPANIEYVGNNGKVFNLAVYGEDGFVKNLLALAIACVGAIILRSQGVTTNVVDKLIDDKKNAELDAKDRHFRIEEVEEKEMEKESENVVEGEAKDESNEDSSKI